jgi:soluble lytic murein transglycosylase-like protein
LRVPAVGPPETTTSVASATDEDITGTIDPAAKDQAPNDQSKKEQSAVAQGAKDQSSSEKSDKDQSSIAQGAKDQSAVAPSAKDQASGVQSAAKQSSIDQDAQAQDAAEQSSNAQAPKEQDAMLEQAKNPPAPRSRLSLDEMIEQHAAANGVPVSLVRRVIMRESRYNPRAVSAGNYGLMQIRLGTARAMGYSGSAEGLLDPETNMTYAVRYLAGAYRAAGGDESRAVALYASGYGKRAPYRSARFASSAWSLFGGPPAAPRAVRHRRGWI